MAYDHVEHRHRLAVWAAARAASRGGPFGAPTRDVAKWLTAADLRALVAAPSALPRPDGFDELHADWRTQLRRAAGDGLSHGKAAKLINVYLKVALVCPVIAHDDAPDDLLEKVGAIHPPIDGMLLRELGVHATARWSRLDDSEYRQIIDDLKAHPMALSANDRLEFWRIEQAWKGFE